MSEELVGPSPQERLSGLLLGAAREIGQQAGVQAILVYADAFSTYDAVNRFLAEAQNLKVIVATHDEEACAACKKLGTPTVTVPDVHLTRIGRIKVAILLAFSRGLVARGDRILCLSGIAGSGLLDALFVTEVGDEFELFVANGAENIPASARTEVFERVIDLALALGIEGREGRPVGATFVLGDTENVLPHTEQLILNPFHGYPADERNILDPRLTETIKEFSAVDGAFVIREDGIVETAGCFLRSSVAGHPLPRGLGARHKSAAAITAVTNAVAVTVSESTGNVTVFARGRILLEIDKPRGFSPRSRTAAPFSLPPSSALADEDLPEI
jgi:DNA integrity scanning protein DisA with diadenylate cyclase activity